MTPAPFNESVLVRLDAVRERYIELALNDAYCTEEREAYAAVTETLAEHLSELAAKLRAATP